MSLWSRLKRRFVGEVQQLYNYTSDQTAPLTYVAPLVQGEYTNKDIWQHLLKVAWEDPVAHRICVGLSQNVFDDWFIIKKREKLEEGEEYKEHEKNQKIQEEFTRMNAKYWFTQALIAERIFGHCAVVFNYNKHKADVETDGYQVATMDVFSDENMEIPVQAYDPQTGIPSYIWAWASPDMMNVAADEVPWDEVMWICTRPQGRSIFGYSAMYAVWDLMVYLRESIDAMVWNHKKYGIGIWMWYIKGLSGETKDAVEDNIKDISSRRAMAVDIDQVDRVEWSGPTSQGTTGIVQGAEFTLGLISSGSGIPKDIFTGVSAGAITGSEINNKALYATISKIQSDMTPYILETIYRMGYDTKDMEIEWNTRYATDELEQAQIRQMNADALSKEKAAERGSDIAITYGPAGQAQGKPKDPTQNNNPTGTQA